jgi:Golgi to ER traffic protein 4
MESFLEKQLQLLEEGKTYEFSQNIENRAKRLISKKEYQECQTLCLTALIHLLRKKETTSLAEFIDLLVKSSDTPPNFQMLEEVYRLLPESEGILLLKKLIRACNDPNIYTLLARTMEDQENIPKALLYWVGSDSFKDLLRTLQILIDRGYPGEQDLFICRTILMLLAFKNTGVAKHLLSEFKYVESPLINFSKFLIQAVESNEKTLVNILKEKYLKVINRDPRLVKYLQQVEKVYFGAETQASLMNLIA